MKKIVLATVFTLITLICSAPRSEVLYIFNEKEALLQLTWSNVDYWLDYYKVENIPIVKAQIYLETGNLSSKFCRENNNLFGMKLPSRRPTTAIGRLSGMAYYLSWIHSIADYKIWQTYFYKGGNYYDFLRKGGYAEDPYYNWKLKKLSI